MKPVLVFDIETIPDIAGLRRLNDLPAGLSDDEELLNTRNTVPAAVPSVLHKPGLPLATSVALNVRVPPVGANTAAFRGVCPVAGTSSSPELAPAPTDHT